MSIPANCFDRDIYVRRGYVVSCVSGDSKKISWSLGEGGDTIYYYVGVLGDSVYYNYGDGYIEVNRHTGEIVKSTNREGHLQFLIGDKFVSTVNRTRLTIFDISGRLIFDFDGNYGIYLKVLRESGIVVFLASTGMYVFNEMDWSLLWEMDFEKRAKTRFPELMAGWNSNPFNYTNSAYPGITKGPLVDGVLYLRWCGHVLALDAATGEELWSYVYPVDHIARFYPMPVCRDGLLYMMQYLPETKDNVLICLDAKTGEYQYQSDEGLFKLESFEVFICDSDYIVATSGKIIAYNLMERKINWIYEEENPRLENGFMPYGDGLISASLEHSVLYWYEP